MRYPALIDGEAGGYGVVFPDLPGCVAMGSTIDEALNNAQDALRDWADSMEEARQAILPPSASVAVDVPHGSKLVFVSLSTSSASVAG